MQNYAERKIQVEFDACQKMGHPTPEAHKCHKCGEMTAYTWNTNWGIQSACFCGWESYYSLGD